MIPWRPIRPIHPIARPIGAEHECYRAFDGNAPTEIVRDGPVLPALAHSQDGSFQWCLRCAVRDVISFRDRCRIPCCLVGRLIRCQSPSTVGNDRSIPTRRPCSARELSPIHESHAMRKRSRVVGWRWLDIRCSCCNRSGHFLYWPARQAEEMPPDGRSAPVVPDTPDRAPSCASRPCFHAPAVRDSCPLPPGTCSGRPRREYGALMGRCDRRTRTDPK